MAKHLAQNTATYAPRQEKTQKRGIDFGNVKLPSLPKVFRVKARKIRYTKTYERVFSLEVMAPVLAAVLLFLLSCFVPLSGWPKIVGFALAAAAAAYTLLLRLFAKLANRRTLDEDVLILIGVVLAFCVGEYAAGAMAMILYRLREFVEAFVLAGGEGAAEHLRDLLPEQARQETDEGPLEVVPETLAIGDVVRVLPNEVFPIDGVLLQGKTEADVSPLTGETEPQPLVRGDLVYAGCLNLKAEVLVQATSLYEDSAMAVRLKALNAAAESKTKLEKRITKGALFYVLGIAVLALIIGLAVPLGGGSWNLWLRRAAVVLLLASPSTLVLSVPLAFRGAVQGAAERGVVLKEQERICDLARTRTMVFGKTGTITNGEYVITDIFPDGVEAKDLLTIAAAAESHSVHPIALALKRAAGWTEKVAAGVLQVEELPGRGVSAFIEGRHVYVGNAALLEEHGIWYKVPSRSGAAIHVAVENVYWGHIMVSDKPRESAFDALEDLRMQGVGNMVMLTGDVLSVSRPIAAALNFDMVKAELSPEAKLSAIEYLLSSMGDRYKLCYVGDGIHDAELMKKANLGITFHALRSEESFAAADMAILGNDILTLPAVMRICSAAYRTAWINTLALAGVKLLLLILALLGALPILAAALIEAVVTAAAMFHALRVFGIQ